jgi:diaminopimelate decarboxylase
MDQLHIKEGVGYLEGVCLETLALQYGTPCYVYSQTAILERLRQLRLGFGATSHRIFFAVKANSNLSLLGLLAREGVGYCLQWRTLSPTKNRR